LTVNIGDRGSTRAHVPACGAQPAIRFTAGPASAAPISWNLTAGTAALDPGTTLASPPAAPGSTPAQVNAATRTAVLTPSANQAAGTLGVEATNSSGGQLATYLLASHPTSIDTTRAVGDPTDSSRYGGVFDHVFARASGGADAIEGVAVGERFPNLPDPDTASHTFDTPFGEFTLRTGTLPDAASAASGNWFLINSAELGGDHDTVSIAKSMVDLGRHLPSDSNPNPTHPIPAGFTVDQDLHWWCPHAAAGSRWTQFDSTTHRRELRFDTAGTGVEFVAVVNGITRRMPYEGLTGVRHATASPSTVAPSPAGSTPHTVQISAEHFPSSRNLHFSIRGTPLGCTIDATTGVLTVGTQTGTVTVRAANARGGPNWDETEITIAVPTPAPPTHPPPSPPTNPGTSATPAPPVGDASAPNS
jgi:hypothetical protein